MTVDTSRFGGGMETPLEVDEMMEKINDITSCAIILLPADMTEKFRAVCERQGVHPAEVSSGVWDGLLKGIDPKVPFAVIPNPHVPPPSDDDPKHRRG